MFRYTRKILSFSRRLRGKAPFDIWAFRINLLWHTLHYRLFSWITPAQHWLLAPFDLRKRTFFVPYIEAWADGAAILWASLYHDNPDFKDNWLGALRTGKVGFDIGAHRGYWLLLHSKDIPDNTQVFAIEPYLPNFIHLLRNLYLNNKRNITCLQLAIGDKAEEVHFDPGEGYFGAAGTIAHAVSSATDMSYRVRMLPLDSLVEGLQLTTVDWIKIDIEGAEVMALRGASRILRQYRPHLWIEIHYTFEEVEAILREYDYVLAGEEWSNAPRQGLGFIWAMPKEKLPVATPTDVLRG